MKNPMKNNYHLIAHPHGLLKHFYAHLELQLPPYNSTALINSLYYMKYSCIPSGSKIRKIISPLSPVAIPFLSTQSAFSIFARFSMVRARSVLSRLLFLNRAKKFKKLFIPIVIVVKWKKKITEMPSRFVDVTDRELTQFLEKI